jgi:hypothetical protein
LGVIVGVATVGRPTARLKEVVLFMPAAAAVMMIVDVPAGVDGLVLMLRVVEHAGLHEADENEAIAPEGTPDTENNTACVTPEVKDALIELKVDEPAVTETLPEFANEKSKGLVTVNEALTGALAIYPLSKAAAVKTALPVSVSGAV